MDAAQSRSRNRLEGHHQPVSFLLFGDELPDGFFSLGLVIAVDGSAVLAVQVVGLVRVPVCAAARHQRVVCILSWSYQIKFS